MSNDKNSTGSGVFVDEVDFSCHSLNCHPETCACIRHYRRELSVGELERKKRDETEFKRGQDLYYCRDE